jgi:hypothetical protein
MRTIALFILLSLIFYSTYYFMKVKLDETEYDIDVHYKEVPKLLLDEQYDFDTKAYFDKIKTDENLWKLNSNE